MKQLYQGKVSIEISTVVEQCDNPIEERNNAHQAFDFELMKELETLVQSKGYHVSYTGVDLNYVKPATENMIEVIDDAVKESRSDEFILRGKSTSCRVYF